MQCRLNFTHFYLSNVNWVRLSHKASLICKLITLNLFSVTIRYATGKTLDYYKHRKRRCNKTDRDQRTFHLANNMPVCYCLCRLNRQATFYSYCHIPPYILIGTVVFILRFTLSLHIRQPEFFNNNLCFQSVVLSCRSDRIQY
jgi:hypothetical protein